MHIPMERNSHDSAMLDFEDIYFLLEHPLGLRLTSNASNITEGSNRGDAVPLANLAGAADIIHFITLCSYSAPTNEQTSALEEIYHRYTEYKIDKNLQRSSLQYLSKLMIAYAQSANIGDANQLEKPTDAILPQSEIDLLKDMYEKCGSPLKPIVVFDKKLSFYRDLPVLRLLLAEHFNQSLKNRLKYNCNPLFCSANNMYYLLLSSSRFDASYDDAKYPMGKAGTRGFLATDVKAYTTFQISSFEEKTFLSEHQDHILNWLKTSLNHLKLCHSLDSVEVSIKKEPKTSHPTYWKQSTNFCKNSGTIAALIGVGIFAGIKILEYSQPLLEQDNPFKR